MVLFPDFLLLDMAGPMEVFSVANRYLKPERHYQLITLGTERGPLRASNGVLVHADQLIDDNAQRYDQLLVPGGPGACNERQACTWASAMAWSGFGRSVIVRNRMRYGW